MSIAHCILTYVTHILPSVQYSADELAIHIDIDSYIIFFKATFFLVDLYMDMMLCGILKSQVKRSIRFYSLYVSS